MQKRQLKADVFPYRREIYLNLIKVLQLTQFLEENIFTLDLDAKTSKDIYAIYDIASRNLSMDATKISQNLYEASYVFPSNISSAIVEIQTRFDDMCTRFLAMESLSEILNEDELEENKKYLLGNITDNCKIINSKISFIQTVMPSELDISALN